MKIHQWLPEGAQEKCSQQPEQLKKCFQLGMEERNPNPGKDIIKGSDICRNAMIRHTSPENGSDKQYERVTGKCYVSQIKKKIRGKPEISK